MKLIFFGTADFSKSVFEVLKKEGFSPILWKGETIDDLKKLEPDICVVAAYGKIISKEWLEIPKFGFLNIHPSILPKYRGPSPIQTAILNGDPEGEPSAPYGAGKETGVGVTIILMDEKIDHGPIIAQRKLKISKFQKPNYKQLEKELADLGAQLLIETLPKWINREIKPKEQNHNEATFAKKLSWPDGKIDWSKSAKDLDRQVRALNPEPGTWTDWNRKVLKILKALPISGKNDNLKIGQVFLTKSKEAAIKCGFQNALLLKIVQLEGKKPMEIKDFLNGHKNFINSTLT